MELAGLGMSAIAGEMAASASTAARMATGNEWRMAGVLPLARSQTRVRFSSVDHLQFAPTPLAGRRHHVAEVPQVPVEEGEIVGVHPEITIEVDDRVACRDLGLHHRAIRRRNQEVAVLVQKLDVPPAQ